MVTQIPTAPEAFKEYFLGLSKVCVKGKCSSVPLQGLQRCMTLEVIKKLLEHHDVEDLDERVCAAISSNYRVVFIIMIMIDKGRDITSIIDLDQFSDAELPFKLNSENWPLGEPCFLKFWEEQWFFCGIKWEVETLRKKRRFADKIVLPIENIFDEQHGSNSVITYVDLLPDYNGLTDGSNKFALKSSQNLKNEIRCYKILMGQRAILKNLVTAYGSYIHMEKDYLVLDYIDGGNLEDLFLEDPPQQTQWLQFWRSLVGAFNPLKRIHSLVYKGKLLHATHQDVKPANIIFSPKYNGDFTETVFRLIDFESVEFELGIFVETKKDKTGETQMFSAPEICRTDAVLQTDPMPVGWQMDTWSFGAVLSETLVWCVLGPRGLNRYRENRASELSNRTDLSRNGYGTCFHNGTHVLDSVLSMHQEALKDTVNHPDLRVLIKGIIGLAENMLEERPIRPRDEDVYRNFKELFFQNEEQDRASAADEMQPRRPRPRPRVKDITTPENATSSLVAGSGFHFENGYASNKGKERDTTVEQQSLSYTPQISASSLAASKASGKQEGKGETVPSPGHSGQMASDTTSSSNVGVQTPPRDISARPSAFSAPSSSGIRPPQNTLSIQDALNWVNKHKKNKGATSPLAGYEQLQHLKGRDKIFIIDTSGSMGPWWSTADGVINAFDALGYLVKRYAFGKMKMVIMDSKQTTLVTGKDRRNFREALERRRTLWQCNLRRDFKSTMVKWWDQNESWVKNYGSTSGWKHKLRAICSGPYQARGLDTYILTDGNWEDDNLPDFDIDKVITRLFTDLRTHNVPRDTVRIHFIQFGNDPQGSANLQAVKASVNSVLDKVQESCVMLDIEPHTGNVWKMLIGPAG